MNNYNNALEKWELLDTVLITSNADQVFKGGQFFTSYKAMANQSQIPFFNVRNRSVGTMYNNMDSANKLPFAFHLHSIGVAFESPLVSYGAPPVDQSPSDLFFASELPKHCGLILRISQDEKLVQTVAALPDGQGLSGFTTMFPFQTVYPTALEKPSAIKNVKFGNADHSCRWGFPQALQLPREVTFEVSIILSDYARSCLAKMSGPGTYIHDVSGLVTTPAASLIRVSMYGTREVQLRNELFFQAPISAPSDGGEE